MVVGTSTFSQDLSTLYSIDSQLDPSWIKIDLDPGRTKPLNQGDGRGSSGVPCMRSFNTVRMK